MHASIRRLSMFFFSFVSSQLHNTHAHTHVCVCVIIWVYCWKKKTRPDKRFILRRRHYSTFDLREYIFFHAYCRFFFAAEIRFFFFFLKYKLVIRSKIVKYPTQLFVLYILWSIVKEETPFKEFPGNAGKPWRKTNLFTLENNTDGRTHCIKLNSRRILRISTFHRSTRRNKNIYVINLP